MDAFLKSDRYQRPDFALSRGYAYPPAMRVAMKATTMMLSTTPTKIETNQSLLRSFIYTSFR